jgi:hypothetical protein
MARNARENLSDLENGNLSIINLQAKNECGVKILLKYKFLSGTKSIHIRD